MGGDGLQLVSRISVGGARRSGDGLRTISRISVYGLSVHGLYRWEGLGGLGLGCE